MKGKQWKMSKEIKEVIKVAEKDLDDIIDGGCPPGYSGCVDDNKHCMCKRCWKEYLREKEKKDD